MRRHTIIGERILAAAPALAPVARLVRSSHERFDGGGYPDGLSGERIPLGARVVAVCDAYDAMTSERPYRRAVSSEDAARGAASLRRHAVRPQRRRGVLRDHRGASAPEPDSLASLTEEQGSAPSRSAKEQFTCRR